MIVPVVILGKNIVSLCVSSTMPHQWTQEETTWQPWFETPQPANERIQFLRDPRLFNPA
jgi:hypothetical protein